MGTQAGEGPLLSSPAERLVISGREALADARTSTILAGINERAERLQALLVDQALADLALVSGDIPDSTSAPHPLPVSAVDGSVGEGPLQPSPTSGPYRHTPYFEGGWAIIGPDNEHVATTKSPTTVFSVVDALNDAYHRGLAEGGAR